MPFLFSSWTAMTRGPGHLRLNCRANLIPWTIWASARSLTMVASYGGCNSLPAAACGDKCATLAFCPYVLFFKRAHLSSEGLRSGYNLILRPDVPLAQGRRGLGRGDRRALAVLALGSVLDYGRNRRAVDGLVMVDRAFAPGSGSHRNHAHFSRRRTDACRNKCLPRIAPLASGPLGMPRLFHSLID